MTTRLHLRLTLCKMRSFKLLAGFLFLALAVRSQTQIYGTVLDAESGEPLIGASVYLEEYSMGSVTDFDGRFRFTTRQTGEAHVVASMIGYENSRNYIQLPARQGGRAVGMAVLDMGVLRLNSSTIGYEAKRFEILGRKYQCHPMRACRLHKRNFC